MARHNCVGRRSGVDQRCLYGNDDRLGCLAWLEREVDAISGERCNPHPHVFSDRMLRPGNPVYYDILHSYMGYRTCYHRTFVIGSASRAMVDAYKRCRDYLDAAIELIHPGRSTGEVAAVWPRAQDFGFPNEEATFALHMAMESASPFGRSPSSAVSSRSSIRRKSSPAWYSHWRPSGPRPMVGALPALKRKSS